jgi:hypothetical protein
VRSRISRSSCAGEQLSNACSHAAGDRSAARLLLLFIAWVGCTLEAAQLVAQRVALGCVLWGSVNTARHACLDSAERHRCC